MLTLPSRRMLSAPILARALGASSSTFLTSQLRIPVRRTAHTKPSLANTASAMFCQQCEQTEGGKGCSTIGVCGKTPEVAHLQDALVHALKGLGVVATLARSVGIVDNEVDRFVLRALFSTLTNVNFDSAYFVATIPSAITRRNALLAAYNAACAEKGIAPEKLPAAATWVPSEFSLEALEAAGVSVGVIERRAMIGEEVGSLQELVMYGIKGTAAYACHAMEAGVEEEAIYSALHASLALLGRNETDAGRLVSEALAVGSCNVGVMKALDKAHTERFGSPVPRSVNTSPQAGKCILISGHDLVDLELLLRAVDESGEDIKVYTHGEMLPAHGYPKLAAFKCLADGGAWQLQKMEYAAFPGPIVQSTNCLVEPRQSYKARLFTTNSTGWPGVEHIGADKNFGPVIRAALAAPGFSVSKPPKLVTTGFGHAAVLGVAPAIIDAVKAGQISRFVLIGGCDGAESERSYYTKLATSLPDSAVILTLGCGKFRVLGKKDYGNVPGTGIPRVLDMGQCNDSYSAVVVASALAQAFGTTVNGLPLSIVLSWFEQKAVAVLLSLISLGVKNIRIGPALPAFVTPGALALLQDKFGLMPIKAGAADGDVDAVMGRTTAAQA